MIFLFNVLFKTMASLQCLSLECVFYLPLHCLGSSLCFRRRLAQMHWTEAFSKAIAKANEVRTVVLSAKIAGFQQGLGLKKLLNVWRLSKNQPWNGVSKEFWWRIFCEGFFLVMCLWETYRLLNLVEIFLTTSFTALKLAIPWEYKKVTPTHVRTTSVWFFMNLKHSAKANLSVYQSKMYEEISWKHVPPFFTCKNSKNSWHACYHRYGGLACFLPKKHLANLRSQWSQWSYPGQEKAARHVGKTISGEGANKESYTTAECVSSFLANQCWKTGMWQYCGVKVWILGM